MSNSAKKRNKNVAKSYNNHENYENAADISNYINQINYNTNGAGATNKSMALDISAFSNQNSIAKHYDNSFNNGIAISAKGTKRP